MSAFDPYETWIDGGEAEDPDEVRGLFDPSLFLGLPAPSSEDSKVGELE